MERRLSIYLLIYSFIRLLVDLLIRLFVDSLTCLRVYLYNNGSSLQPCGIRLVIVKTSGERPFTLGYRVLFD